MQFKYVFLSLLGHFSSIVWQPLQLPLHSPSASLTSGPGEFSFIDKGFSFSCKIPTSSTSILEAVRDGHSSELVGSTLSLLFPFHIHLPSQQPALHISSSRIGCEDDRFQRLDYLYCSHNFIWSNPQFCLCSWVLMDISGIHFLSLFDQVGWVLLLYFALTPCDYTFHRFYHTVVKLSISFSFCLIKWKFHESNCHILHLVVCSWAQCLVPIYAQWILAKWMKCWQDILPSHFNKSFYIFMKCGVIKKTRNKEYISLIYPLTHIILYIQVSQISPFKIRANFHSHLMN